MDSYLTKFCNEIMLLAKETIKNGDQVPLTVMLYKKDPQEVTELPPVPEHLFNNRQLLSVAISVAAHTYQADNVILVTEAWAALRTSLSEVKNCRPSKCDDKKEVIMITVVESNGQSESLMSIIERTPDSITFKDEGPIQESTCYLVQPWDQLDKYIDELQKKQEDKKPTLH